MLAGLYALGVAAGLAGAGAVPSALLLLSPLLLPIPPWIRPPIRVRRASGAARPTGTPGPGGVRLLAVGLLAAGLAHAHAHLRAGERDCRRTLADGTVLELRGHVRSEPRWGRVGLAVREGMPGGCAVDVTVRLRGRGEAPEPGSAVRVEGRWRADPGGGPDPARAGILEARTVEPDPELRPARVVRWQLGAVRWVRELFPRRAALVSALVLARKDGLDPEVRDAFARAGTAHLLAISGFHVGVVAGLLMAGLRGVGLGRRSAAGGAPR